MDKKDAWVALFTQNPKKGTDFEPALSTIAGDREPDADVDAALDDGTRERIGDFLMDPGAFIQANASDFRRLFWVRMIPAPTVAPAAKPKAAPKPVVALHAKPAPAVAPASVVLAPRQTGLNPNALAAAARAATAAPVKPTLPSMGNVPAPAPTPAAAASPTAASVANAPVAVTVQTALTAQPVPAQSQPARRAASTTRSRARPANRPVATSVASSWGPAGFILFSGVCCIICLLVFKWVVVDTLLYADASAKSGLHQKP